MDQSNHYYKWRGGAFDSTLLLPTIAASIGRRPGAIYYKSADSQVNNAYVIYNHLEKIWLRGFNPRNAERR